MDLNGTAKKIYIYLLKRGKPVRLSEIRRDLNLNSSALVKYHVDNLAERGLVRKVDEGVYEALPPKGFLKVWRLIIPFKALLASMLISSIPIEFLLFEINKSAAIIFFSIVTTVAATYITYDAYKSYEELTDLDSEDDQRGK